MRDTQSDPTKAVNAVAELTPAPEGRHHLGSAQLRRGAGGDAADRARQGADAASVLGRRADRRQEVPDGLPHRADQHAGRRRRQLLRGRRAQAEEGGGHQRHHRLRHGLGQHLRADAQGQGRRGRLHEPCRRGEPRPQARAAAHAERRRAGDHAVERERRLPVAHSQHPRRHGLGRAGGRPDDAGLRPDQGAAREARELEQGLLEQLPPGLLRRRQAAGARPGVRRAPEEGQGRDRRHAVVVDRARLGRRQDDERDAQGRRAEGRRHRRLLEQDQGLAGRLRHRHLDAGAAQRLPRHARS